MLAGSTPETVRYCVDDCVSLDFPAVARLVLYAAIMNRVILVCVAWALLSGAHATQITAASQALESARDYLQQAVAELPGTVKVQVSALDPRLRLQPCEQTPEAFLPSAARLIGNLTVGVRCPSAGWTVYTSARVDASAPVLIAARPLLRGQTPAIGDLRLEVRDLTRLHGGYLRTSEDVAGKRLKRSVRAGAVIVPGMLESIPLVQRGETVTLRFDSASFRVIAEGTALEDAGAGEHLRIRSHSSNRIIYGRVGEGRIVTVLR